MQSLNESDFLSAAGNGSAEGGGVGPVFPTHEDIDYFIDSAFQSSSPTAGDMADPTEAGVDRSAICDLKDLQADYRVRAVNHKKTVFFNCSFCVKKMQGVHGYLSLVVCIFGTIANILNIVVLTRKEMNGSPINRILTGEFRIAV